MEEVKWQREKKERQAQEREEWQKQKEQKKWDEAKKAADRQPSPSKVQADARQSLARAPISQLSTELLPTAQQPFSESFQDEGIATNDLARRQQEWQVQQMAAATRKMTKREKEEQWRQSTEQGAFKTIASRQQLINHFKVIIDRHQRCQMMRNEIMLGHAAPDPQVHLK